MSSVDEEVRERASGRDKRAQLGYRGECARCRNGDTN
jgi:hypothetical protein